MLKQYFVLTGAFIAATMLSAPASAENKDFEQLYIFGNSISDTGNVYELTNSNFPPFPFYGESNYEGRFSNGKIWVDFLADESRLGLNPGNFYPGDSNAWSEGINFSFGGATTGNTTLSPDPRLNSFGVERQINDFVNLPNNTFDKEDLVIIWAGENDYSQALLEGKFPNQIKPENTITNITSHATKLAEQGAKNIVVANLVDLGSVPLAEDFAENFAENLINNQVLTENEKEDFLRNFLTNLDELTIEHNELLDSEINLLKTSFTNTNFLNFDVNSLLKNISNNPESFGLNLVDDSSTPCWDNNFPNIDVTAQRCDNPDQYMYYDNQHYTSVIHEVIADQLLQDIETKLDNDPNTTVPEAGNTIGIIGLGLGMLTLLKKKKAYSK